MEELKELQQLLMLSQYPTMDNSSNLDVKKALRLIVDINNNLQANTKKTFTKDGDKLPFVKVCLPGEENGLIVKAEEFDIVLESAIISNLQHGSNNSYEISIVFLTEEEFQNIPHFKGF